MRMNILVVCQYYKPEPFRISDLCEALAERGHSVTVVTGLPNYPAGELYPGYEDGKSQVEMVGGVTVHRCTIRPRKTGAVNRFLNYYSFVAASKKCLTQLQGDFDVVFVNQLSPVMMAEGALVYARKHGLKTVLYCLDLWPESLLTGGIRHGSLIYKLFLKISRRIYSGADEICITSRGFARYFKEVLRLPEKHLTYLPQYAEALFDDVPPLQPHELPYHFLFAGNIGEAQSVETIVEAARLLQEDDRIRIHIVGDGVRLTACKQMGEGLPNLTFHGRRDVSAMPDFYAMADGLLVTLKDTGAVSDTLPGKVQSYMAAGRAVVGAVGGETAAVVADADCGVCVEAEDAAALAQTLSGLVDHPEKMRKYGQNARSYSREYFAKSAFLERLEEVLAERVSQTGDTILSKPSVSEEH